jgi:thiol-disulfide isomerase/thioredoxin
MNQTLNWLSYHYLAVFVVAITAGVAILATIKRPRRWFLWAIDAVVVLAIAIASLTFWFFATVTRAVEHRTKTLTYASLGAPDIHRVAELRGNVVVLNYWATWCPPCRKEMPDLSRLADSYRGKGVIVLTISDEEPELLQKFLAKYPQSTTTARFSSDSPKTAIERMAFGVRPATLILGRDGRVRDVAIGGRTYEEFDAAVRASM